MWSVFKSKYFLYLILAIPLIPIYKDLGSFPLSEETYANLLHLTGEMSVRIFLLTLFISPFKLLFPKNKFWKWMLKHRRQIGIIAFLYLLLHFGIYLVNLPSISQFVLDLYETTYITGWLAFIIMLALALTSNSFSVKMLGAKNWKNVHRFAYLVILLSGLHWLSKEKMEIGPIVVHFLPLLILEMLRFYKNHDKVQKTKS